MDLSLTDRDVAFRDEVRTFLGTALTPDLQEAGRLTSGVISDFARSQRWYEKLSEKGWVAPTWPREHGGPGWDVMQRYIFDAECARAGAPRLFSMGIRMAGPVIMKFGTPEQKSHYLPRIINGTDVWCQGYSEPGSGSDLASLQCRAESDGDDYIVNGTKIWTTGAHNANSIFMLVRTSNDGKPQQGISFLLVDMATPGIAVEPIITLAGDHEVNQVFFDDVRVPKSNLIGAENDGWTVAKYLLEFERGGTAYAAGLEVAVADLKQAAGQERIGNGSSLQDDPTFAGKIADAEIEVSAFDITERRIMSSLSSGQNPGAASSMLKLRRSELMQKISELAVEAIAYYAAPFQPEIRIPGNNVASVIPDYAITYVAKHLNNRAATIYAGSSEVQRSIIAKQVLGI